MHRIVKLVLGVLLSGVALSAAALAASSPSVSGVLASSITTSSAVLHGKVNPEGAKTTYQFEWGLTTQYGEASTTKTLAGSNKTASVQTTTAGLLPGTVYHFRLVALNKSGVTVGIDHTFRTGGNPPPSAATGPATGIGTTSATVTGVVNPHGEATIWAVQYGLTTAYGVQTFPRTIPAGNTPVAVSQPLPGLAPGAVFHYRIVALHNGSVTQAGADASFITLPKPRPAPDISAKTTPHHDGSAPFAFTTSGKVRGPSFIPAALDCKGNVRVEFLLGKRAASSKAVTLQPDCSYSVRTTFKKRLGHGPKGRQVSLRVQVRFGGNSYLAPASARAATVTAG